MPKKPAFDNRKFNNKRVTKLALLYSKNLQDTELRNKIIEAVLPLINAAMIRRHVEEELRDDMQQECVLKLLHRNNLAKFDPQRATAFAFFWTVICNTISKQKQRMFSRTLSLTIGDSDDEEQPDIIGVDNVRTPENHVILDRISKALDAAFAQDGFKVKRNHQKVFKKLKMSIQTGDYFLNQSKVLRRLEREGIRKSELQMYADYLIVKVRQCLLDARKELDAVTHESPQATISKITPRGVQGGIWNTGDSETG